MAPGFETINLKVWELKLGELTEKGVMLRMSAKLEYGLRPPSLPPSLLPSLPPSDYIRLYCFMLCCIVSYCLPLSEDKLVQEQTLIQDIQIIRSKAGAEVTNHESLQMYTHIITHKHAINDNYRKAT